ncbi:hypothetical protein EVAR_61708_1 [Eumeta japonica]|uniref:Uncharacterized protein n=1 Tax=Eumeta variegata TaxID=151549 RepID=A0A4C1ZPP2_EUMVA|nr:hypothetical protein EVAR_61708_1 [Eumeta japonica]
MAATAPGTAKAEGTASASKTLPLGSDNSDSTVKGSDDEDFQIVKRKNKRVARRLRKTSSSSQSNDSAMDIEQIRRTLTSEVESSQKQKAWFVSVSSSEIAEFEATRGRRTRRAREPPPSAPLPRLRRLARPPPPPPPACRAPPRYRRLVRVRLVPRYSFRAHFRAVLCFPARSAALLVHIGAVVYRCSRFVHIVRSSRMDRARSSCSNGNEYLLPPWGMRGPQGSRDPCVS